MSVSCFCKICRVFSHFYGVQPFVYRRLSFVEIHGVAKMERISIVQMCVALGEGEGGVGIGILGSPGNPEEDLLIFVDLSNLRSTNNGRFYRHVRHQFNTSRTNYSIWCKTNQLRSGLTRAGLITNHSVWCKTNQLRSGLTRAGLITTN